MNFILLYVYGFDLSDRISLVYIVMFLVVACLFGCAFLTKYGESSMSPTPSLQNSCSAECVFVGLGDRVQHSSFCDFCIPVPAGEVVHRYGPVTDRYRITGRAHRPVT